MNNLITCICRCALAKTIDLRRTCALLRTISVAGGGGGGAASPLSIIMVHFMQHTISTILASCIICRGFLRYNNRYTSAANDPTNDSRWIINVPQDVVKQDIKI